jgi:hypothetical protein
VGHDFVGVTSQRRMVRLPSVAATERRPSGMAVLEQKVADFDKVEFELRKK